MPVIDLEGFSGIVPRTGAASLGKNNAQVARNVKLQSGELRPWRLPVAQYKPSTPNCQGIYKLVGPNESSIWLEFPCDVDVVASPMADAGDYRIYYTGANFEPRKTNWAMANGTAPYPTAYYEMGVPAPTVAPTLVASATAGVAEVRAYVYTYVNQFGSVAEESAPSPAQTVTVSSSGATVTVSGFGAPPAGKYNYTAINLYRTVAGTATVSYQFVAQLAITATSYVDSLIVTQLGQVLPSTYFTPPPANMKGMVEMPNGMLAGFVGNEIWFCEPYFPHAWPLTYMLTVEFPIVGLGVFGNSLYVGTTKNPYLLTGTTPSSMSQEKLPILQACVSKRSIVSDQWGVVSASPNGLLAVGPGVQDIVTQTLYTRDEWQELNPAAMVGVLYNNMYIGFYPDSTGEVSAIVYTRADIPPLVNYDFDATCVFVDRATGAIFAVSASDNTIYQLDADLNATTVYQWRSKQFIASEPCNFGALKVAADWSAINNEQEYQQYVAGTIAADAQIFINDGSTSLGGGPNDAQANTLLADGSSLAPIPDQPDTTNIQVAVFADGVQVFETPITGPDPIRMPGGYKGYVWEVLITGNAPVRKLTMATTIAELRQS